MSGEFTVVQSAAQIKVVGPGELRKLSTRDSQITVLKPGDWCAISKQACRFTEHNLVADPTPDQGSGNKDWNEYVFTIGVPWKEDQVYRPVFENPTDPSGWERLEPAPPPVVHVGRGRPRLVRQ